MPAMATLLDGCVRQNNTCVRPIETATVVLSHKRRVFRMRKVAIYIVAMAALFIVIDLLSSYFLFFFFQVKGFDKPDYSYATNGRVPTLVVLSKAYEELSRRLGSGAALPTPIADACIPHADPSPLYHYLKDYGYGHLPGHYEITMCPIPGSAGRPYKWSPYKWNMTIDEDLGRRTATSIIHQDRKIIIFG